LDQYQNIRPARRQRHQSFYLFLSGTISFSFSGLRN
jgi:hypothetical protein